MNLTRGTGLMSHVFDGYAPLKGEIPERRNGVLISQEDGDAVAYALWKLQERGRMFVSPGEKLYEGMIIGIHSRDNDLVVNPIKGKQLTNVRASGTDEAVRLVPPIAAARSSTRSSSSPTTSWSRSRRSRSASASASSRSTSASARPARWPASARPSPAEHGRARRARRAAAFTFHCRAPHPRRAARIAGTSERRACLRRAVLDRRVSAVTISSSVTRPSRSAGSRVPGTALASA